MPVALLVTLLLALAAFPLAAQVAGDTVRVRIGLGPDQVQGIVHRLDGRALELVPLDRATARILPLEQVMELERRDGFRRRPMTGAALGYFIGAVGAQIAFGGDGYSGGSEDAARIGGLAGIGAGLVAGYLIRTPRWRRVSLVTVRPDLLPGQLVRGAAAGAKPAAFEGVITRVTPDSLYLARQAGMTVRIARRDLTSLEWPVARERATRYGAGIGTLVGGLAGVFAGLVSYDENDWFFDSPGETALLGGLVGVLFGATIGSIAGATTHRTIWEGAPRAGQLPVTLQAAPMLAPDRAGVLLRISW